VKRKVTFVFGFQTSLVKATLKNVRRSFYGGIWCDIIIFVLFGDGDCGGGQGYFHGEASQVDKKETWDRIRGDSRTNNKVFFSC